MLLQWCNIPLSFIESRRAVGGGLTLRIKSEQIHASIIDNFSIISQVGSDNPARLVSPNDQLEPRFCPNTAIMNSKIRKNIYCLIMHRHIRRSPLVYTFWLLLHPQHSPAWLSPTTIQLRISTSKITRKAKTYLVNGSIMQNKHFVELPKRWEKSGTVNGKYFG